MMMIVIMMMIASYINDDDHNHHAASYIGDDVCIVYALAINDAVLFGNERTDGRTRRFYE